MMADARRGFSERRTRPPLWVVEGLDVVERRRLVLLAVTGTILVVGALLAWLAPGIVPPRAGVGAAIAVAALLLGIAAAVASDATDLYIRGPRHVSAAGGELVAVLSQSATAEEAVPLAAAVFEARDPGQPLLLGLAASGKDTRATVAWTDALATALEAEGASVLCIDLASGSTERPGLAEVVHEGVKLAGAVTFGPEPRLARLGAGADQAAALDALTTLPGRLPRDLDVLLVSLPMAASRQVVGAVRSLDHILIVARRDRTSRVELIAGLDALEAAGTRAQVALVDEQTAARLGSGSSRVAEEALPSAGFTAQSPAGNESASDDPEEGGADEDESVDGAGARPVGDPAYDEIVTPPAGDHDVVDAHGRAEDVRTDRGSPDVEPSLVAEDVPDDTGGSLDDRDEAAAGFSDDASDAGVIQDASGAVASDDVGDAGVIQDASGAVASDDVGDAIDLGASEGGAAHESDASATPGPSPRSSAPVTPDPSATSDAPRPPLPQRETSVVTPESEPATPATPASAPDAVASDAEPPAPGPEAVASSPEPATVDPEPAVPDADLMAVDADNEAASDARSADLLSAAAAAAALAQVVSEDEPIPVRFADADHDTSELDGADSADPMSAGASDDGFAGARLVDAGSDATDRAGAEHVDGDDADGEPGDADRTDELPRVDGSPPVRRVDDEHDDLLRTTAQLSVLMDDLDGQGR